ncbi:methyltransferase domain-containing protein [uncultured Cetobacterium sp.]|uniref:class I SAM-dependent methyltransferase n=1 Tax=uncultured Cetobacterium sp. TaxID=527638 RepID=UPI00260CE6DA|nr:methyltransferase domain-containing protein [uncultured Cetobacterium sp.]
MSDKIYMGEKLFWENKFLNRKNKLMDPDEFLINKVDFFKKGSVLDIACGDGRNSLFLSENGFEVTGVDFSDEALKRLLVFSKERSQIIKVKKLDVSKNKFLDELEIFDNIIINHYKLPLNQLLKIHYKLKKNGILYICGFGEKNKINNGLRKEDLLLKSDINKILDYYNLISFLDKENDLGNIVQYILRKK